MSGKKLTGGAILFCVTAQATWYQEAGTGLTRPPCSLVPGWGQRLAGLCPSPSAFACPSQIQTDPEAGVGRQGWSITHVYILTRPGPCLKDKASAIRGRGFLGDEI